MSEVYKKHLMKIKSVIIGILRFKNIIRIMKYFRFIISKECDVGCESIRPTYIYFFLIKISSVKRTTKNDNIEQKIN